MKTTRIKVVPSNIQKQDDVVKQCRELRMKNRVANHRDKRI